VSLETPLGPGREFDRIRAMAERWRERARGLGDDCAFVETGGATLAISVDLSVEGVHFRRDWLTAPEIGYRAAAAALSDLAAVAAEPVALLLALVIPEEAEEAADGIADGVGEAAADAGAVIVGGDLSSGDRLVVDCCVLGRARHPVRRRGARPGDRLVVTGALGGPLAALTAWRAGREPDADARRRFVRPEPRHAAARWLAEHGAHAMIDVSDGLTSDLGHLAAASGVGARVEVERLPVHASVRAAAATLGEPPWRVAARSGEEYELLAALPAEVTDAALAGSPVPLTVIGGVEAGPGVRAVESRREVLLPAGWDHFSSG
jgi:thiamine-monophosphate kinase